MIYLKNTLKTVRKTAGLAVLSCAMLGVASSATNAKVAKTANWQEHPQCYKRSAIETPKFAPKKQVKIIGVGMSEDGELMRYELKTKVHNSIPDNFTFAEQGGFLDSLTHDDFITMQEWFEKAGSKPDADMRTHFDVGSNIDRSYIYLLLPKSWRYSDMPIDLKIPAKKGMHPFMQADETLITSRAAILHHRTVTTTKGINCYLEFNLNVEMLSTIAGHELVTKVIIDPGGNNFPNPPFP